MTDEKKDLQNGEDINTIENGEKLEEENAKEFGEPVK